MITGAIIKEVSAFNMETEYIFRNSPFYPEVAVFTTSRESIASTIIRKKHHGKWYSIHLVRRVSGMPPRDDKTLVEILHREAYKIVLFYKIIARRERLCSIQISEEERLIPGFIAGPKPVMIPPIAL